MMVSKRRQNYETVIDETFWRMICRIMKRFGWQPYPILKRYFLANCDKVGASTFVSFTKAQFN
jgi:hypothetical protein